MRAVLPVVAFVVGFASAGTGPTGAFGAFEAGGPSLLPALDQQARSRYRDGELGDVVELRRRALAIAVRAYGSGSPKAAAAMAALARAYIDRRRYLDAEPLLIAAQDVSLSRPGADQRMVAGVLAARARVAVARGEPDTAALWAEQAVAFATRDRRPRSSEPWRALAAVRAAEERFDAAEHLLGEALARDRARGEPLPLARTLSQLGNLYVRQKRFGEALPVLAEAAALDRAALAATHALVADDFADLALAYEGLNRLDTARLTLAFAVKLLRAGSEKHMPRLAYVELELVRILRTQGQTAEADALHAEARTILSRAEDEERERERRI